MTIVLTTIDTVTDITVDVVCGDSPVAPGMQLWQEAVAQECST